MAFPGPEISLFLGGDSGDFSGESSLSSSSSSPVDKSSRGVMRSVYVPGPYKPIEDPHVSQMLQYYMHNIAPWVSKSPCTTLTTCTALMHLVVPSFLEVSIL
jgi:hypothetical protein